MSDDTNIEKIYKPQSDITTIELGRNFNTFACIAAGLKVEITNEGGKLEVTVLSENAEIHAFSDNQITAHTGIKDDRTSQKRAIIPSLNAD